MRAGHWVAIAVAPLAVFALLLARPAFDHHWENHPAHFWIVLGAAAIATALSWGVTTAARRRRDARLVLISLACIVSASFFGLHALATPGVLLGKNAGFELATPVGLLLAGAFAACAAIELEGNRADRVLRRRRRSSASWWRASSSGPPSRSSRSPRSTTRSPQSSWTAGRSSWRRSGIALFGIAAFGFLRIHRRRQVRFVLAFALAFALLAEAMVVIAWARNWQYSWWEWHVLMLASFVLIAVVARTEWHEERYSALYLDETLSSTREVSVILADLAGYTAFTERHPVDEVAAMLNAYFGRIIPLMERAGGEVHQIVGDELMVLFGKDASVSDHAFRAARAALVLQRVAKRTAADHDDWPQFRVGVSSGDVHAGLVGAARGHRKHGVVGDVVNLAARLQTSAPVGGVLIGEATFRELGPRAVVQPLAPMHVKGKREPVSSYLLQRLAAPER